MKSFRAILITGASSGLGRALAELYAAPGVTLLLTGRNALRMKDAMVACRDKGATVEATAIDVTDREAFEKHLLEWDDKYKIDLIIANAGISGGMGRDSAETENIFREIMRTNLDGTFNTVNPLIPRMKARRAGQIVLLSSMAGFRGLPSAAAYSVSKNAVRAYGEALRPLLKPHGIGVNVVCPGFIRTPMTKVNDFPMPFLMEVDEAARRVKAGIEKDKPVIAFPLPMFLLMSFITCLPRRLGDFILSKAPKKP